MPNTLNSTIAPQRGFYFMCYEPLAGFLRSADQALIIQRLHYWLQKEEVGYLMTDGCKWVFNGYKEWLEQFTWFTSVDQFGRHIRHLEKIGWIETARFHELTREVRFVDRPPLLHSYNQRKWYKLNYQKIYEDTGLDLLFEKYGKKQSASTSDPKPAPLSNLQEPRLKSTDLQELIYQDAESSYKEIQSIIQNTTEVVCEKTLEIQEEVNPDSALALQVEVNPINSCCAIDLKESGAIFVIDPNGGTFSAAAPPDLLKPKQLKLNRVNLKDPRLLTAAAAVSQEDLADAVDAFLEYCTIKQVEKPTRCLIQAIELGWKPENPHHRCDRTTVDDPIKLALAMWTHRWFGAPATLRPQMKRDIEAEFPAGEIVVVSDLEGPVRGCLKPC